MTDPRRQQVFRRLLAREAGKAPDSSAVAAAACRLFEHFAHHLTPIIGNLGVAAVYGRSLHLARQQLPWLPPVSAALADRSLTGMQLSMQHQETRVAMEAALIVLTTISEQLASFIGESLTLNLLSGAWPDDFAGHIAKITN